MIRIAGCVKDERRGRTNHMEMYLGELLVIVFYDGNSRGEIKGGGYERGIRQGKHT